MIFWSFFEQFVNFVSDFGGLLGLWVGFSVLTAAELVELVLLILHHLIKKCTNSEKSPATNEHDHELRTLDSSDNNRPKSKGIFSSASQFVVYND